MGWFGRRREERQRWSEFASLEGEEVTPEDASQAGLPGDWFEGFVSDHFRSGHTRAEGFRFALDDPSVRGLLRYKLRQRELLERLAPVLDESLAAHDAIVAGDAGISLAAAFREAFPEREEVLVRELCPEVSRRAVSDFLLGRSGAPSLPRIRRALVQAGRRRERLRQAGEHAGETINLNLALSSVGADEGVRSLLRSCFGSGEEVTVGQLLSAIELPGFAQILDWFRMMKGWD